MMQLHDFDQLRNLTIGVVDYVSPNEIKVLLEPDAPQNTALNTGVPCLFPRINGFVLIPNEVGALVGIINWIGTEHSPFPKRRGFKDYNLIDLPFPSRKMMVNPIGTLKTAFIDGFSSYKLERGIYSFPSVGDCVIIPKDEQLKSIVENDDEGAYVKIGTAPIAGGATVRINPDKLFGRHVAVLGNTGSGKSCTAAGLIRWSLEEAKQRKVDPANKLNCRFIILDPNGEYSTCFDDLDVEVKRFKVELSSVEDGVYRQLKVPAWLWNSYEWSSFSHAAAKTQKPILRKALRELKNGIKNASDDINIKLRKYLQSCSISIRNDLHVGLPSFGEKPGRNEFGKKLNTIISDVNEFVPNVHPDSADRLQAMVVCLSKSRDSKCRWWTPPNSPDPVLVCENFSFKEVTECVNAIESVLQSLGTQVDLIQTDEDAPIAFDPVHLPEHIDYLAKEQGVAQLLDFLIMRIKTILADGRMKNIIGKDADTTLESWLNDYLSGITIIDLSLVPADIVHIVVAVISRISFEAIQRYRRMNGELLPTVLMLEEAHNFIKRCNLNSDDISTAEVCSQTFEKIAKEGRKFGMSLFISSQRPSELSDTVLSQCNTFLLHRIVNDRDQDLIKRLVPDNIGGLLKELPVLPTQKAILLGWASPLPILVKISPLIKEHCPKSHDPDFWQVWTGENPRSTNWDKIAQEWQGNIPVDVKQDPDLKAADDVNDSF